MGIENYNFQLWSFSGESCPEGTIPIRRIKEDDMLRACSINTFGRKLKRVRMDTTGDGHEVQCHHRKQQKLRLFCLIISFILYIFMFLFIMVKYGINKQLKR
jgi:hypothetical protein